MSTTVPQPQQPGAPGSPEMSAADRVLGVFTEPVQTFASIARKPDFLAPLIAMMAITIATTEILLNRVGAEQIVRKSLEESGRASTMSPDQLQNAVHGGAAITTIIMHVSGVIGAPIFILIMAVIGMFIMKLVYGRPVGFKTAFSLAAYADLPMFLAGILGILVIAFGDPGSINPRNLTPTNIGFFMDSAAASKALLSIGTSIDFFSFWLMGLLGIAFASTTANKVKPRSVFFCFLGLWVIFVLLRAGLSLI